jgi:hypothetical protein
MPSERMNMKIQRKQALLTVLGFGTSLMMALHAQAAQPAVTESGWQYEATPYLWFPGTKGHARIGTSPQIQIDQSPSEALRQLDLGLMGTFEARNDRWAMVFDGFHVRLSDGGTVSQIVSGAPVVANGDVGIRQTILSAAGYYRVSDGATAVDLVSGARYVKLRMDAELSVLSQGQLLLTRNPVYSESWVDPFLGVRVIAPLAPRWSLQGYADVGGFGLGSDNTWQLQAGATYEWGRTLSTTLGYRALHLKYKDSGFHANLDFQGVYVGLGIKL